MEPPHSTNKAGSALLVTLLVMGLMTMLVLAFSTHVRLELRNISNHQDQHLARANARLGLELALAQLQVAAGPDQRVTATSNLISGETTNRLTGVWNTSNPSTGSPTWLVSGPGVDSKVLLGSGTLGENPNPGDIVSAPLQMIFDANAAVNGAIAWWTADEGVKASVGKWNRQNALSSDSGLNDDEIRRMRQVTMARPNVESFFNSYDSTTLDTFWDDNTFDLSKMTSRVQLMHLENVSLAEIQALWHDITRMSYGVLANTESGRLKRDLSYNGVSGDFIDSFMSNPSVRNWINHRPRPDDSIDLSGTDEAAISSGSPVFTTPLVFTEFALYLGVFRREARSNDLRLQIRLRADVWNPHSFPMAFSSGNAPDILVEIEHLPSHEVRWETARGTTLEQSGDFLMNIDDLLFTHNQTNANFIIAAIPVRINSRMGAGEVRTISESAQAPLSDSINDLTPNLAMDDRIWTSAIGSEINVRIREPDGRLLQEFRSVPIPAFDTADILGHEIRSNNSPSLYEYQFVYHFRYYDETTNAFWDPDIDDDSEEVDIENFSDMEVWSKFLDPRGPVFDLTSHFTLDGGSTLDIIDMFDISNPGTAANEALFLGRPEFFFGGSGTTARSYYRFFDIPSTTPISVGSLQHISIKNTPPFIIGSQKAGDLNKIFDNYFFSSVPQTNNSWDPMSLSPLANNHLLPISSSNREMNLNHFQNPLSSTNFLVKGSFNINSLSREAWMAILGGINIFNWQYRVNEPNNDPINRLHVLNGLFRFKFGADRHFRHPYDNNPNYPEITQQRRLSWFRNSWQPDWAIAYTVGMRELRNGSSGDEINDLEELAQEIVDQIRERGAPFGSISEFANSGLLQKAINNTRINSTSLQNFSDVKNDVFTRLPINAPSYLTQADIFQAIAPVISTRSDTFLIRVYGDSRDQSGNILAREWCEVEVQRIPEPFSFRDRNNPNSVLEDFENPPDNFGRRFIIKSFRWLKSEEI